MCYLYIIAEFIILVLAYYLYSQQSVKDGFYPYRGYPGLWGWRRGGWGWRRGGYPWGWRRAGYPVWGWRDGYPWW